MIKSHGAKESQTETTITDDANLSQISLIINRENPEVAG